MSAIRGAILAGLLLMAAGPLSEPRPVRFRLADGVLVSGALTFWDAEGIDGSFGRRLWVELMPGDAWRLYLGVMDQKDAHQWVDLGRVLLLAEGGDAWAERAFQRALRLDAAMAGEISAARDAARETRQRREQLERPQDDGAPQSGAGHAPVGGKSALEHQAADTLHVIEILQGRQSQHSPQALPVKDNRSGLFFSQLVSLLQRGLGIEARAAGVDLPLGASVPTVIEDEHI